MTHSIHQSFSLYHCTVNQVLYTLQEHEVEGGGSGSFQGVSYFSCHQGHGLFLPVSHLKGDDRFSDAIPDEAPSIDSSITSGSPPKSKPTITPDPLLDDLLSKLLMDSSRGEV